ncbi:MAG: YHS domain-containing protein [Candidatus Omnitrophica bacterium]|nr:YHS domain-containing protein [Candidatus Omnitrophota bacterium]
MKEKMFLLTGLFSLFIFAGCFAAIGVAAAEEQPQSITQKTDVVSAEVVEAGNTICPVSGDKVGSMGPNVRYEYKGKIYSFCCEGCVPTFKEDPEKYIKMLEEMTAKESSAVK